MSEDHDLLIRMDEKLDDVLRRLPALEARVRILEEWKWKWAGAVALGMVVWNAAITMMTRVFSQ